MIFIRQLKSLLGGGRMDGLKAVLRIAYSNLQNKEDTEGQQTIATSKKIKKLNHFTN